MATIISRFYVNKLCLKTKIDHLTDDLIMSITAVIKKVN